MLKSMGEGLEKAAPYLLGIPALVVVILANLAVVYRYILQSPLSWSEELLRYMFVWIIFIGTALAYKNDELVDISMLTDMAKGRLAKILEIIRNLLCLIFIGIFTYEGAVIFTSQFQTGEISPAMEIPLWIVSFGIFVGGVLWLYFGFAKFFVSVGSLKE
ncbi:MAG: TRAP transporter small permease [Peptococcaceae bacterium]